MLVTGYRHSFSNQDGKEQTMWFGKALSAVLLAVSHAGTVVHAGNCIPLNLQKDRSRGVTVSANGCDASAGLALGSMLVINGHSRLWLKSKPSGEDDSSFLIICQNNSANRLWITVNSPFIPWITPRNLSRCEHWVDNRLSCRDPDSNQPVLLCAIATVKNLSSAPAIQRKTSISMRGIKPEGDKTSDNGQAFTKIIDYLDSEIKLCKKMFQVTTNLDLTWRVTSDGSVADVQTAGNLYPGRYAECALDAIRNAHFPASARTKRFNHIFGIE